ncbi:hypothetical protein [Kitasatospora sp. NPDC091207]|uniref:hypothetical protein n=1 Tax=Kitasatospora sp. NPDC091207 TaxID=3364083 RepID=UPI00381556D0
MNPERGSLPEPEPELLPESLPEPLPVLRPPSPDRNSTACSARCSGPPLRAVVPSSW